MGRARIRALLPAWALRVTPPAWSHGYVRALLPFPLALAALTVVACGASTRGTGETGSAAQTARAPKIAHTAQRLRGDEDDDDGNSETENPKNPDDGDADRDHDYNENVINGYYDADDTEITRYGHAGIGSQASALDAFAKRYFTAAAADDGATTCAMIKPSFANSIALTYGSGAGPVYMRGSTCSAVMTRLFQHIHSQVAAPITVSAVRVQGHTARIVVGSPAAPASFLPMEREGSTWKLVGLIGTPLP